MFGLHILGFSSRRKFRTQFKRKHHSKGILMNDLPVWDSHNVPVPELDTQPASWKTPKELRKERTEAGQIWHSNVKRRIPRTMNHGQTAQCKATDWYIPWYSHLFLVGNMKNILYMTIKRETNFYTKPTQNDTQKWERGEIQLCWKTPCFHLLGLPATHRSWTTVQATNLQIQGCVCESHTPFALTKKQTGPKPGLSNLVLTEI